jgi:hypothetical protein
LRRRADTHVVRRIIVALAGLSTLLTALALVPAASAGATQDAARGLNFQGLQRDPTACHDAYRLTAARGQIGCTHGPDAAPAGLDVRNRRAPDPWAARGALTPGVGTAAATAGVQCIGTGSDGDRVQAIYTHASSVTDHFAQYQASFAQWAGATDGVFNTSAAETNGTRHVRFLTDSSCNPIISDVTVSTAAANDFGTMISELQAKGYTRTDRKYLVWSDANVYCGIAQVYGDDSPGQTNLSNGSTRVSGEFARVDNGCWGLAGQSVEAHELMHTMGGVQTSAPHATRFNHCWDQSDRMCYDDGSGSVMRQICPTSHENVFDCNHDDYFYAGTPPTGNYLATHWNTADSVFLAGSDGSPPPPQPSAPTTTVPSPPRNLVAKPPATGGIKLTWSVPANKGGTAITGYDVYRRTASGSYALLKSVGAGQRNWRDVTTTSGTTYYYVVEAKNAVGSSPNSNEASATPR